MSKNKQDIKNTDQYLTFKLADELYSVEISKIREVLEFKGVTRVPKAPEFMRGVINLRGGVVPVVDLKMKFGMGKTDQTISTCVIITEIELEGEMVLIGALADSVQEVIDLSSEQIEPAPSLGTKMNTEFIKGLGKNNDEFIIILDIERIFSMDELARVVGADSVPDNEEFEDKETAE